MSALGGKISYEYPRYCFARWTSSPEKSRKALHGQVTRICEYFHIYLHGFTFAVVDDEDIECEIRCKIKHVQEEPGWRNWQTQRTQNPPVLGTLGVRLPLPAPAKYQAFNSLRFA